MVKSLEVVAASDSLTINCRKTKILSLTRNPNAPVQVGGEQIEAVDKFTHLGSEIDASDGTDLDLKSRIKKSQISFCYFVSCLPQCESEHWTKTESN